MSSVSEREKKVILDLLLKRITEEQFFRECPLASPGEASARGLSMLRQALEEHDADGVEFGLYLGHQFGITPEYLDVLMALATEPWHKRHEDVVVGLQKLKSPRSVDALYRAAFGQYPYRDYDESESLGVKCIWALAKLQTPEAVLRLGDLARSGNEILKQKAAKRLRELEMAGASDEVREVARKALEGVPR